MKRWIGVGTVLFSLCLIFGLLGSCGGGGGSGDGGLGNLEGTWLGWIEDKFGTIEEFSLKIDGAGNITDSRIGLTHYGTGHINEGYDENVFHVLYDVGGNPISHGVMIVDDQFSHAAYGDYGSISTLFMLGVLEKGAIGFPPYDSSDIVGTYPVGGAFTGELGVWEGGDITMTVNPDLTFSGNAPDGAFTGNFYQYDSDYGRYTGALSTASKEKDIVAYVSPDGTAVAGYAIDITTVADELEDFSLIGLKR